MFSRSVSVALALGLGMSPGSPAGRLAGQAGQVGPIGQTVQGGASSAPAQLTILSREGRRTLPITLVGGQEFVGLDDLAAAFQLAVREESGAITVSSRSRTVVLNPEQTIASVAGRLITLPAPPARAGGRWLVPIDFISRAVAPIVDARLDLRRPSHLVVVGDLRVPRVTIRYEPVGTAARITIDASPRAPSTVTQDAGRLSVRFDADALDVALPSVQAQGLVQAVRVVEPVTVVLDLGPRFASFRGSTESIENSTRLVVDLAATASDGPLPVPTSPVPTPADLSALRKPEMAIRTIVLDAGHGGDDVGVTGAGGVREKDLTLAIARRTKAAVEGRLGVRVLMTRDDDRAVPNDDRTSMANNNKADLLISLHANASPRASTLGATVYVAAFEGPEQARATLAPERLPTVGGGQRDIELVLWDLAQIRYVDQSAELARMVEQQFHDRVPLGVRPIDRAPFRVLESANMPAVLIEVGYLSNPDQERALGGSGMQNTIAQALVDSIVRFRDFVGAGGAGGDR